MRVSEMSQSGRAARWLGLPKEVVENMPDSVQRAASRDGDSPRPPDWFTEAANASEIGSPGEAVRLWRLLYAIGHLLAPASPAPTEQERTKG